jgi:hypothetical protein
MRTLDSDPSLAKLEAAVLSRIAAHRDGVKAMRALTVPVLITVTALASGLATGIGDQLHRRTTNSSEAALLAEEATLAPSSLLASNQ